MEDTDEILADIRRRCGSVARSLTPVLSHSPPTWNNLQPPHTHNEKGSTGPAARAHSPELSSAAHSPVAPLSVAGGDELLQPSRCIVTLDPSTLEAVPTKPSTLRCARTAPEWLLLNVFSNLSLLQLVTASHVCTTWREVILWTPALWSTLSNIPTRALKGLAVFLARAEVGPVDLELEIDFDNVSDARKLADAIADHMHHIRSLSLHLPFLTRRNHPFVEDMLHSQALILRRFRLVSPHTFLIPSALFSRKAPRLCDVSLNIKSLPPECPAFARVRSFMSCDGSRLSVGEARNVFVLCPEIQTLEIHVALLGEANMVPTIVDRPLERLVAPSDLFTLRTLEHERILRVTIPHVSEEMFTFIHTRMGDITHVTFARLPAECHVALADADGRARIFPRARHFLLNGLIKLSTLFQGLTSLAIPDQLQWKDTKPLLALPHLRSLTILVGLVAPHPGCIDALKTFEGRSSWRFPALQRLRLSASEPFDMLAPQDARAPPRRPRSDVAAFIQRGLGFSKWAKLPHLVVDGVVLEMDGTDADTDSVDLYALVSDVVVLS